MSTESVQLEKNPPPIFEQTLFETETADIVRDTYSKYYWSVRDSAVGKIDL